MSFTLLLLTSSLTTQSLSAMNFMLPEEISALYTADVYKAARCQFTTGFGSILGIVATGFEIRPIGCTNILLGSSLVLIAIFSGLMATLTPNNIKPGLAFTTIAQFAGGCIKTLLYVSITYAVPDALIGSALGTLNLAYSFGPAFGSKCRRK